MADSVEMRSKVKEAVDRKDSLRGMRKSFRTILDRQEENAPRIPDLRERKERLRRTKEASVGNEALLTHAVAVLKENGFRVILAKNSDAALRAVKNELRGYDLVVKSKSNVTKELHLGERLREDGTEVVETDLGDRIVQLAGCQAVHPTGPACHLTRKEISELFSAHFRKQVSESPAELTSVMRAEIADYLSRARVGITGANAITANEGAVVIVHNEGNAAKCAMLPDKHIIIATPEKIVPTLDDAVNVTKLQTYLSTGKIVSSYINVITGPSYTADIEKQVCKGMHGPREVVIILVDDGRLSASDKEPQYCIGCGMCLIHCPVYSVIGPMLGSSGHMGGQGVYLSGSLGRSDEALESGLFLCTSCGACVEVCPASVGTKKGIMKIRSGKGIGRKGLSPEHEAIITSVRNYDNPWQMPRKRKSKWSQGLGLPDRGPVLFFAGCSTSLLFPDSARRAVKLIRACGVEPAHLGQSEKCCGSTLRKLGSVEDARKKAEACFNDFRKAGAKLVIATCPGCASTLNQYQELVKESGVNVQHITQFLASNMKRLNVAPVQGFAAVTYHDPCDLGRELRVFDEPRAILSAVLGRSPIEMIQSRESSACCGSGSGVKSAYPELAEQIGMDRIAMAREAGAEAIVTSCPWCVQNLTDCQHDSDKMEVFDLLTLLEAACDSASESRVNAHR